MSRRGNEVNFDELYSLKVDNLPYNTNVHELRRMFDRYGDIGDVYIPRDRRNNQSRGFGFVRFFSKKDAEYACTRADGKMMSGRELRVTFAKYRRPLDEERERRRGGRYSRSRSRSPRRSRSRTRSPPRRSRSRSPHHSRSPVRHNDSRSRSRTPRNSRSPTRSRSRSLSRSRSPRYR